MVPTAEIGSACGGRAVAWKSNGRTAKSRRRERGKREKSDGGEERERDKKSDFLAKLPFYPSRFLDHIFFVTTPIRVYSVFTNSFRRALRNGVSRIPKFFLD